MPRSRLLVRIVAATAILSGGALTPFGATASAQAGPSYVSDPASLVNPMIGTTNGGDVFPGADEPFGMIQWSPDTPNRPSGGGYDYNAQSITGYSLTHLSGPGLWSRERRADPADDRRGGDQSLQRDRPLVHSQETASPGYYQLKPAG